MRRRSERGRTPVRRRRALHKAMTADRERDPRRRATLRRPGTRCTGPNPRDSSSCLSAADRESGGNRRRKRGEERDRGAERGRPGGSTDECTARRPHAAGGCNADVVQHHPECAGVARARNHRVRHVHAQDGAARALRARRNHDVDDLERRGRLMRGDQARRRHRTTATDCCAGLCDRSARAHRASIPAGDRGRAAGCSGRARSMRT